MFRMCFSCRHFTGPIRVGCRWFGKGGWIRRRQRGSLSRNLMSISRMGNIRSTGRGRECRILVVARHVDHGDASSLGCRELLGGVLFGRFNGEFCWFLARTRGHRAGEILHNSLGKMASTLEMMWCHCLLKPFRFVTSLQRYVTSRNGVRVNTLSKLIFKSSWTR